MSEFSNKPLKILDVGCGNYSYSSAQKFLNVREYVGTDKQTYDGDDGYSNIQKIVYFDLDHEEGEISKLDDDFDLIIVSHVIEHTIYYEKYIPNLINRLSKGGYLYIETPHPRTINYPSAIGFLNFKDDPTHVRIFSQDEVETSLSKNGLKIIKSGIRRDMFRIIFVTPIAILLNLFYYIPFKRKLFAGGLWDILGVAFFVFAKK